jgi:hypothetical protein
MVNSFNSSDNISTRFSQLSHSIQYVIRLYIGIFFLFNFIISCNEGLRKTKQTKNLTNSFLDKKLNIKTIEINEEQRNANKNMVNA